MDFWDFVWGSLVVFFFAMFLVVFVTAMVDVFASRDLKGWQKALWVLFLIVLPVLGVLIYMIVRGPQMAERRAQAAVEQAEAVVALGSGGAPGPASELAAAKGLLESGAIDQNEFAALKAKILA